MAKVTDVNNIPATGAEAIFILKELLKSAGWTVPKSSDGSVYNSGGDQISHGGSGAGGMANSSAWFVIREPGGLREWCFQKGSASHLVWRVKVSSHSLFVGGAPDATHTPTATDQQILVGAGTDASPTFATTFNADGSYAWHVIADNAPIGTAVPSYGFWAFSALTGSNDVYTLIMQEPMMIGTFPELSSGTRAAPVLGDPDPVIYMCMYSVDSVVLSGSNIWQGHPPTGPQGWYKMNYVGGSFTAFEGFEWRGLYDTSRNCGTNPYNGADDCLPVVIGRTAITGAPVSYKGICHFLRYAAVNRPAPGYPNTLNLAADARAYAQSFLIPWENNTLPIG